MADKRAGRRNRRRAVAECRRGRHRFGSPKSVGGGMTRQTCFVCGAVSIDLRQADVPSRPIPVASRHAGQ